MIRSNRLIGLLIVFFMLGQKASAQNIVNHHVDFATSSLQSMWGANGVNFSMNQTIPLFPEINWNEPFSANGIVSAPLGLGSFGAAIDGFFSGTIGCEFSLSGFSLGQLEVDYPIDITLDMPNDLTYDQGDDVVIQTEYELAPGYALDTYYPTGGEAALDLYFGMGAGLSATVCLFGCATVPLIPSFNTGIQNINIFTLNVNEVSFLSLNGGTPLYSYPIFPLNTSMIPGDPLGQFGLNGTFDVPYVATTDYASGLDLIACGESPYVNMNLDIFALLSNLPIPGASALAYLSGTQDLGCCGAYAWWNFMAASVDVNVINKQCFDFTPKVYGEFEFPVPVEFQIIDEVTGALTPRDTSSIITVEIGDDLLYKFPCYFEDVDITPTYSIDGIIRNHTWDSIPVDFLFSAFGFGIVLPEIELIPAIVTPELCIGYPCGWFDWCTSCWDPPDIPAVTIDPPDFNIGPLIDLSIPITAIEYDWFDETWSLDGFDEYEFPPFSMTASLLGVSNVQTDILCHGDATGSVDASFTAVSPATPYTYDWTNGANTEDINLLTAGPYELTAFDANGCQLVTGATILEPNSPISITTSFTDKSCNGGVDDGTASLLIQGGTPPYSFLWSNGSTSQDLTGLATGTYTVTTTDANGCQEVASITIAEPNVLGQVGAVTDVLCRGGNDGEIAIDVFGGSLPYSYSWNSGQSIEDLTDLIAGTYTLTLTDINNCTSIASYDVIEPATNIALGITGVDILCKEDSTGSVDLTVNGGTPGYMFQWSNSQNIVLPYATEDLTNVPADTYSALVTDMQGCTETISITLVEPNDVLATSPILVDILCNGDATGSIDPVISGGTAGYNYLWDDGSTGATYTALTAGTHILTLTDNNGCPFSASYDLSEPTALVLQTSAVDVLCHGESTGEVEVIASGAVPNYTYLWNNGSTSAQVVNLPAGNYSVDVTDAHGCVETSPIVVNEPIAPLSVSYVVTDVDCHGSNTGSIDMTAADGTGPYSYLWSNSGSIVLIDTTEDITNLLADTYLLTITDANNCVLNSSTIVDQPTAPIALTGSTVDILCFGGNNGEIDLNVTGGTSGYTFAWSNGSTTEDQTNLFAGVYDVVVTDLNGCTENMSFTLNEPPTAVTVQLDLNDVTCLGGSDGFILTNVGGGVGPYTYLWSNGETTDMISNIVAGAYSLTVTDANGCTAFTGGVIKEPATTITLNYIVEEISCFGGSDGTIGIGASGGVEPYYYNWGNQNNILMAEEGEILDGLNVGDYLIQVTDANGCVYEEIINVPEPPLLESSFTTIDVLCNGDATGSVDVDIWGGTDPYTSVWSTGANTEDVNNIEAGWYTYEITDFQGCTLSDSVQITQPVGFWSSHFIQELSCMEETDGYISIEVGGGVEPFTYMWSTGSDDTEISNLTAGTYSVVFEDAHGCMDSLEFVINPNYESCLEIPNTFTPNGDDYNDTWFIEYLYLYPNAEVAVFNKWGNELYRSDKPYVPWDGTVNGVPLPSEVYYYIILLNNDQVDKYTGVVTIIR